MTQFLDVDPSELENVGSTPNRGYTREILEGFIATNKPVVRLDRSSIPQKTAALTAALRNSIKNNDQPVKVIQRNGEVYLKRTDLDTTNNPTGI